MRVGIEAPIVPFPLRGETVPEEASADGDFMGWIPHFGGLVAGIDEREVSQEPAAAGRSGGSVV